MRQFNVGAIVPFGGHDWRVLDIKDDAALLVTEHIAELRIYHDSYKPITWADCALRKYLNGEFHEKFSKADRSRILATNLHTPDNPWHGSPGGVDTQDKVFVLSIEEAVCRYFGDSSAKLQNRGKNQNYWFQRKDENNDKRRSTFAGYEWWWWLRSPGRVSVKAAYIHGDGNIGIQGNNILKCNISSCFHPSTGDHRGGVRPSLWLKL
ncbi:DUF6273 domain-containing protein [Chitiniphilus shinanonensis]|uniref:DUF6273 domain-containing protein n=1 Tax=Chitiniphilus shinanonensis TaxID=553088 RepID=UPI00304FCD33